MPTDPARERARKESLEFLHDPITLAPLGVYVALEPASLAVGRELRTAGAAPSVGRWLDESTPTNATWLPGRRVHDHRVGARMSTGERR